MYKNFLGMSQNLCWKQSILKTSFGRKEDGRGGGCMIMFLVLGWTNQKSMVYNYSSNWYILFMDALVTGISPSWKGQNLVSRTIWFVLALGLKTSRTWRLIFFKHWRLYRACNRHLGPSTIPLPPNPSETCSLFLLFHYPIIQLCLRILVPLLMTINFILGL